MRSYLLFVRRVSDKDLFYHTQNVSNWTLYPDVLKIKTNCCEIKFYKNAICLLFTNFQIHHLAKTSLDRVARYGFINKKWHFWKILFDNNHCFCFQKIWIQCRIWHILSAVKQILDFIPNGQNSWYIFIFISTASQQQWVLLQFTVDLITSLGTNSKIPNFEYSEHWMSEHWTFWTSHFGPKLNFKHVEHHKKLKSSRTSNCKFQD